MKPRLMFGAARAAFLVVGWSGSDAAAPTKPTGERSENELYGEGYLGLLNTLEEAYGAPHHHAGGRTQFAATCYVGTTTRSRVVRCHRAAATIGPVSGSPANHPLRLS